MTNSDDFRPDWASPPGATIQTILRDRGISTHEFARTISWSDSRIVELLEGRLSITISLARQLREVLGASTEFWMTRDHQYRALTTTLGTQEREWLNELPVGDMIRFGWLTPTPTPSEEARVCLDFFGVQSIDMWQEEYIASPAMAVFRSSPSFDSRPASVAAWLRRGILEASKIQTKPWDSKGFRDCLEELRSLSREKRPSVFLSVLRDRCAEFGVAIVPVRALSGCRASGAAKFLTPDKAVIVLSFRHRTDDHFWFSFFHEAAHLVLHASTGMFVDADQPTDHPIEQEANALAANILVPPEHQEEMRTLPRETAAILRFARRIGISPGIVVGQLQHAGRLGYDQFHSLKRRYQWTLDEIG